MAPINIIFMVVWVSFAIIFLIIELVTLDLTSFWFSVGALAALFSSAFQIAYYWQILVFALVTVLTLASLKPIISRTMKKTQARKTNLDLIIGKKAKVIELLDNPIIGQVKIDGKYWLVITENNEILGLDDEIEVIAISGVKLVVRKEDRQPCHQQPLH